MDRRQFVKTGAAATLAMGVKTQATSPMAKRQPNVLYVFADQHRAQSLPGEAFSPVIAPHLEKFRSDNFSMDSCISNYPLCTPYRGILMTGQWPTQTGITHNNQSLSMAEGALGETFQAAGYSTGYIGKWHLGGHGERPGFIPPGPRRLGFEDWQVWDMTNQHYDAWTYDPKTGERIFPGGWQPVPMTDEAITFLKAQRKGKPWFLMVSYNPPHPPYNPPKEEENRYSPSKLPLRPNVHTEPTGIEMIGEQQYLVSEDGIRQAMQGYYGAISGIDEQFARLLKTLDETGQAENTIVIYTSDHGDMLGSHGRMGKQVPFEESCRVPFIVRYPGVTRTGGKCDVLFAAIDIYPTLCGLAGIRVPSHCAGRDFSGVIRGEAVHESDMVFLMNQVEDMDIDASEEPEASGQITRISEAVRRTGATHGRGHAGEGGRGTFEFLNLPSYRGVRTKRHTYAVTLTGRWLLYSNSDDPHQMRNLVHDPAQLPLMQELDAAIEAWMKSTGDAFPFRENTTRFSNFPT